MEVMIRLPVDSLGDENHHLLFVRGFVNDADRNAVCCDAVVMLTGMAHRFMFAIDTDYFHWEMTSKFVVTSSTSSTQLDNNLYVERTRPA